MIIRSILLGAAMSLAAAAAHAALLDFSGSNFTPGTLVDEPPAYVDLGGGVSAQISAVNKNGKERRVSVLDSDSDFGSRFDPDLRGPLQNVDNPSEFAAFGNVLIIQEKGSPTPDDQAGGGILSFAFKSLVSIATIDLLDIEELTRIFVNGTEVASGMVDNSGCRDFGNPCSGNGPNQFKSFDINMSGVETLDIHFGGSGALGQIALVPLPASLPLLLVGLGGLYGVRRRMKAVS